jgi:hypothetical protein
MGYQSKKIRILSLLLILSHTWIFTASAKARPYRYNRFADWCRNKKTLPPQTRKTVEVMLSAVPEHNSFGKTKLLGVSPILGG